MSWPNSGTEPRSGRSSPVMRLNNVVLPAPFGPMISRRSPGVDGEIDIGGDPQPAERLAEVMDDERGHGRFRSAGAAAWVAAAAAASAHAHSRTAPGTRPSGMNTTMATKIAPSTKFQRSI